MKSKNILRILVVALIAIACIIIFPNVVNADVTYTRTIVGSNKSFEFTFSGLTLTEGKQYQFALTKSAGVTADTKWYNIANTTATTAVVNLNAADKNIASILKEIDTGYIYIKATDSADGTYVLDKKEVDLKLPMLDAISYSKAGNWYSINELYNTGSVQGSGIGQGNGTISNGTYYQFQKVTDREFIEDYLQIKNEHGNTIALQSVLPAYPTRGYAQSGYFSAQDYSDGLYILWIEQVGTGTDKTVHGAIIHDGKPTATTLDEYLGTTPSPSPSASPSPSPSQSPDGTWADISKMKVELESGDVNNDLNISGISVIDGHEYYVYVTKNKMTEPPKTSAGFPQDYNGTLNSDGKARIFVNKQLELKGATYLYIYENYRDNTSSSYKGKFIVKDYEIQRPEIKLGSRIKCYFFGKSASLEGYTSTFLKTPHDSDVSRKIKLKIGKVTDINILRAIKNGDANCLERLLDYAKKADKIYEGTVALGNSDDIASGLNIVDDEYYYVYMVAEDEGKYYPVEDVSLYQALIGETVGKNLFDYLSDEFKWNIGDDPAPTQKPDDTTMDGKLPQTGQTIITAIIVVIVSAVGVIFYIKAKEYKI